MELYSALYALMKHRFITFLLVSLVIFSSVDVHLLWARDRNPKIENIIVTSSDGNLLLSAEIVDSFTQAMLEDLQKGIPLQFVYSIQLVRKGNNWFDTSLSVAEITHTLVYLPEKGEYEFSASNQTEKVRTTSLAEAQRLMNDLPVARVGDLSQLVTDQLHAIHLRAVMKKGMLPWGLDRFVSIKSIGGVKTDWRTIEFRY